MGAIQADDDCGEDASSTVSGEEVTSGAPASSDDNAEADVAPEAATVGAVATVASVGSDEGLARRSRPQPPSDESSNTAEATVVAEPPIVDDVAATAAMVVASDDRLARRSRPQAPSDDRLDDAPSTGVPPHAPPKVAPLISSTDAHMATARPVKKMRMGLAVEGAFDKAARTARAAVLISAAGFSVAAGLARTALGLVASPLTRCSECMLDDE